MLDDPALAWAVAAERSGPPADSPIRPPPPAPEQNAPPSAEARWPAPRPTAPFHASTALVAALARLPAREVPGLRMVLRPEFDLTPETTPRTGRRAGARGAARGGAGPQPGPVRRPGAAGGVAEPARVRVRRDRLGQVPDRPEPAGAGHAAGIPWLVVEPAKAEYRLMAARLPGTRVIRDPAR